MNCGLFRSLTHNMNYSMKHGNCQPSCCLWAWLEVWPSWSTESWFSKVTQRSHLTLGQKNQLEVGGPQNLHRNKSGDLMRFYLLVFQLFACGLPTNTLSFRYFWSKWLTIVGLIMVNLILLSGKCQMGCSTRQSTLADIQWQAWSLVVVGEICPVYWSLNPPRLFSLVWFPEWERPCTLSDTDCLRGTICWGWPAEDVMQRSPWFHQVLPAVMPASWVREARHVVMDVRSSPKWMVPGIVQER